ncbi:MAG: HAD-IC family P-type ATPase [Metallibacterium scheffleri]|uniref:cation-translocating P-type ATPase n=1 Tax=Metallibacterium scheffleri TaxID=993689 RepID=UPI0026EA3193|nr:HAD-IC family P-type ATPase [Metallibacterium scheffleri]MCK9365705.1 HAD-IC family P-type ATPase [Metallibacterium scheffleri]
MDHPAALRYPHAQDVASILAALHGNTQRGLDSVEAQARLARHGANRLPEAKGRGAWLRLALQFHNPLIYVLLAAAVLTLLLRDFTDSGVIVGVVIVNAIIGFVQEGKAEQALTAVRRLLAYRAVVLRDGLRQEIDAATLVPGDVVLIESGSRVPADLRLFEARSLRVDEAALTGESEAVDKSTASVADDAALAERSCMAWAGTEVRYGQARGVVVATGTSTELGRIGHLVSAVPNSVTPLTRRLDRFARQVTLFIVVASALIFIWGLWLEALPPLEVFLAVVGLAVAAIPEGLPAIVTIVLALGARAMARHHALLRRLPAAETLGSVSVICTDKTGTLTRNEMTAVGVLLRGATLAVSGVGYVPEGGFSVDGKPFAPAQDTALRVLARAALLCNDAQLQHDAQDGWSVVGDPADGALLTLALKAGLDVAREHADAPRVDAIPFESERRYMATLHRDSHGHSFVLLKGAPERVLELCTHTADGLPLRRDAWDARIAEAAASGRRLLAIAQRDMPRTPMTLVESDIAPGFTLLGLVVLQDPPRPEAATAVAECRNAGIRVLMITGDHAITAAAIGNQLGLRGAGVLTGPEIDTLDATALRTRLQTTDVIARASPEHKLRLIAALKAEGAQVAMTGDGVNDAPALKAADIGVAMGLRGTDAARAAADLVLGDDNFASVAHAVREGRRLYDNIRKALLFILPTNGGEAGVILLAVLLGWTLPVSASQILWVNLVTEITLSVALAFEPAEPGIMRRPPRAPGAALLSGAMLARIAYVSLLMTASTFFAYEWELARGVGIDAARTAAVNMLVIGEMVYLFNMRRFTASSINISALRGNAVALWVCALLAMAQALFTYAPPLQAVFHTRPLDAAAWLLLGVLGAAKFLAVEAEKWWLRRRGISL